MKLVNKIKITFSGNYGFDSAYDPYCDNLLWSGLKDKDSATKVTCTFALSVLTVTNF